MGLMCRSHKECIAIFLGFSDHGKILDFLDAHGIDWERTTPIQMETFLGELGSVMNIVAATLSYHQPYSSVRRICGIRLPLSPNVQSSSSSYLQKTQLTISTEFVFAIASSLEGAEGNFLNCQLLCGLARLQKS